MRGLKVGSTLSALFLQTLVFLRLAQRGQIDLVASTLVSAGVTVAVLYLLTVLGLKGQSEKSWRARLDCRNWPAAQRGEWLRSNGAVGLLALILLVAARFFGRI